MNRLSKALEKGTIFDSAFSYAGLLSERVLFMKKVYRMYLLSRSINDIGDTLQDIAVLSMIAFYAQSTLISGIIVSLNALVRILCSFTAIQVRIRADMKRVLRDLDILYGVLTLFFFLVFKRSAGDMSCWIIVAYETLCSLIYTYYRIYQDVIMKDVCRTNEQIARLFTMDNIISVSVSMISGVMIVLLQIEGFLLLNALSFFVSASIVDKLDISSEHNRPNEVASGLGERIRSFRTAYPFVFSVLIVSSLLSFFYATYDIVFQAALRTFAIDARYIGILKGIDHFFVILSTYIAGFLRVERIKGVVTTFLACTVLGLILSASADGLCFIMIITLTYSVIGGGYNSFCQIIFQARLAREDIPTMKGIYNILCGTSIMLSGAVAPILLEKIPLGMFCLVMAVFIIGAMVYFYISQKVGDKI